MSKIIQGIAAAKGYAIAKAYLLSEPEYTIEKKEITDRETEMRRLDLALDKAKSELEAIRESTRAQLGDDKAEIFSAHLLVLHDPELVNPIKDKIISENLNAEFALEQVAGMFIEMFEQMDNDYMKERAADIRDVTKRVLFHLLGIEYVNPSNIMEEAIIIAKDLTPSDTAQLNKTYVKGFATDIGGRTSHSAIMARSLEIPAIVGTKNSTLEIKQGDIVIIDGIDGQLIVNPSSEEIEKYRQKQEQFEQKKAELATLVKQPTITIDQHQVELAANIGTPKDVESLIANGGEGVGLYRTEFLYMGRDNLPTEEEQFIAYKTVLEKLNGKPVVVRTLDIGGDKELSYLELPKELNPFLGFRAIRLTLEKQEIFRTQLRALLRASIYGNLKVMFPMIATLDEFRAAKQVLLEEKKNLLNQGIEVAEKIEIGMMVEIPSSAVMANQFAKEVDFFSVGTNDLIQYTMAADRMNEKVSYLYQPYNPAILRLVDMVIKAAHQEGKWAGMCGEMAGDSIAIPILLGLGLDEFSMSATSILPARSQIRKLSKIQAEEAAKHVLTLATSNEVETYIKEKFQIQ